VGGTQLHLDASGARTAPDNVWNDTSLRGQPAAGGGGVSSVFTRPAYQSTAAGAVGTQRGIPDVSMSAAVYGAVLVYTSFAGQFTGWEPIGGTSEATPLFAGIVAIANQVAGHGLGQINPTLYKLKTGSSGLTDITQGNNTVSFSQGGKSYTVSGYSAAAGYDLASGLGTPNAPALVAALARPTVTGVTPNSGPTTGGTKVTISGTNFLANATVAISQGPGLAGAIPATNVTVVSPTEITATTGGGAKAGTFHLYVTTSVGTSAAGKAAAFTYTAAATSG
jgi:subtilase family serine protease